MRIPRIYITQALAPGPLTLEPEPSRHIARALRMREGSDLTLFDGTGGEYHATLTRVDKKHVEVTIDSFKEVCLESPLSIHLGIAVSRGERFDWVVQKATELGVTSIQPLWTQHTGVKLVAERIEKKLRHWQQIAISACEQCGRNTLPTICQPVALDQWIAQADSALQLVLHTAAKGENLRLPADSAPGAVDLLIGPEGGFSDTEIEAATAAGFANLQLGPRILRTETAPVAAIAMLQSRWGDFLAR